MSRPSVMSLVMAALERVSRTPADDVTNRLTGAVSTCARCGGAIREDWRLCPHCGAMLSEGASVVGDG